MKNLLIALAVIALIPAAATAAPLVCNTGEVTFAAGPLPAVNATACAGFFGGPKTDLTLLPASWGTWDKLNSLKAEAANGYDATLAGFLGYDWRLQSANANSGEWFLTLDPITGLPIAVDFLVVLKAGSGDTSWAAYLFDGQIVHGDNQGEFVINFQNGGGNLPALSHMTLYLRQAPTQAPEPASMILLATGLLGTAAARRRQRR